MILTKSLNEVSPALGHRIILIMAYKLNFYLGSSVSGMQTHSDFFSEMLLFRFLWIAGVTVPASWLPHIYMFLAKGLATNFLVKDFPCRMDNDVVFLKQSLVY